MPLPPPPPRLVVRPANPLAIKPLGVDVDDIFVGRRNDLGFRG